MQHSSPQISPDLDPGPGPTPQCARLVGRDDIHQAVNDVPPIAPIITSVDQLLDLLEGIVFGPDHGASRPEDPGVLGRFRAFLCSQQLLEKLLPRPEPAEYNGDIDIRLMTAEPDHFLVQVEDPDGLPPRNK